MSFITGNHDIKDIRGKIYKIYNGENDIKRLNFKLMNPKIQSADAEQKVKDNDTMFTKLKLLESNRLIFTTDGC